MAARFSPQLDTGHLIPSCSHTTAVLSVPGKDSHLQVIADAVYVLLHWLREPSFAGILYASAPASHFAATLAGSSPANGGTPPPPSTGGAVPPHRHQYLSFYSY